MFSPYYRWSGRTDPLNHCAINVALYGPRAQRWAMTERGRNSLSRDMDHLTIGPSSLNWDGQTLIINIDEVCAPLPRRIRGNVRLTPSFTNANPFVLEDAGQHIWRPIAPLSRVEVDLSEPDLTWQGHGYFDMNAGAEPLDDAFETWTWSRARVDDKAIIFYDAKRRRETDLSLALQVDRSGAFTSLPKPPIAPLPRGAWGVARETRADGGTANLARGFEDSPFYTRSLVDAQILGVPVQSVHESLDLNRLKRGIVQVMLPFRMPRRSRWP